MRFLSALLLSLVALSTPSDAVRHTATHKLARLASRTTETLPIGVGYSFDTLKDLTGLNEGVC